MTSQGGIDRELKFELSCLRPELIRSMDSAACRRLAGDIREFLIEHVSVTGGHLGANLGTVELTLAIHRAFDSPTEAIVFDIGHQAYTHKILTGRGGGFPGLRTRAGLSGFPSRAESPHDVLENSHASTGPAWALGIALIRGTRTVVVLGDGALTGGAAFEALNAIGMRQLPIVIAYNDNGRSYAPTMSRLTLGEPWSRGGGERYAANHAAQFFASLGYDYIGPVDGHDLDELDDAFAKAAAAAGPVVVHANTQKGYGWADAERDEIARRHQVGGAFAAAARPQWGLPLSISEGSWGDALGRAVCDLGAADPRVHLITAAMPDMLGLLEFKHRFPDRFHDVGISEQLAVGLAAGLAGEGCRPIFPVFATFLTRGLDQVINDVALHDLPVTFVLDRAGVSGGDGPSSHGIYDVGLLRMVPGLEIHAPTGAGQLASVLQRAVARASGPTAVRYGKWPPLADPVTETGAPAVLRRRGGDLCLLAHGAMVQEAMSAAAALEARHHVSSTVWEVVRLRPAVEEVLADAARHRVIMTVEDLVEGSGLYPDLLVHLADTAWPRPATAQMALAPDFFPWGVREDLLAEFGLSTSAIVRRAEGLLGLGTRRR
ncbi:1-deoxy-D-xylulose-5-phosphate synthase [Microbispora sp. CA-102843]|uniref:1-deoxy-D-xylulose-5-phosphate synthase n=1 Tax=Microbispora sp. CA-102843 TaxID=3239952 RepID=UPI003D92D964